MALEAIDYIQIQQLYSRFNLSVDLGDIETYVATFAEDGWYRVEGVPDEGAALGINTGRQQIRAMVERLSADLDGQCRHFVNPTSMIIEGDEHEVTTRGYLYLMRAGTTPNVGVYLTGLFNDTLRKIDGQWLFATRSVRMDPQTGTSTDVLIVEFDRHFPRP